MAVIKMLFSEVYSVYYKVMEHLIELSQTQQLNDQIMKEVIENNAFQESFWFISSSIKQEEWALITKDFQTPLLHQPHLPLTDIQRAFLKSMFLDQRIQLFIDMPSSLIDVEPLYNPNMFYTMDVFKNGDPYSDPQYIAHFKIILEAVKHSKAIKMIYTSGKDKRIEGIYFPDKIEYSAKEDRFRILCKRQHKEYIFNIARIESLVITKDVYKHTTLIKRQQAWIELELKDYRNALERLLTSFANYKKETKQIDSLTYRILITYFQSDETELLIRILSFGPMIKVLGPDTFIHQLKNRIHKQIKLCN